MADPITIRAHHLESAKKIFNLTREQYIALLIQEGYITDTNDPFVTLTHGTLLSLIRDPDQEFIITSGTPDFICAGCRKQKMCFTKSPLVGQVFLELREEYDQKIAEKYGFEINNQKPPIYTSRTIRERLNF